MYQKSAKAGSQSGIGRLNGHGEVSQPNDTEMDNFNKPEVLITISFVILVKIF